MSTIDQPPGLPDLLPDEADGPGGRRRIGHSALITAFSNSILPITSIASGPILAHVLGPKSRGDMAAVLAPLFVASFVAGMALPDATTYAIAKLRTPIRHAANTATLMLLPLGAIAAVAIWFGAPVLLGGTPEAIPTLRTAVWSLPFMMIALMQRAAIAGNRNYRLGSLERTTAAFGRLFLIIGFALFGVLTATSAVWSNIAPNLAAMALFFVLIRRMKRTSSGGPTGRELARKMGGYGLRGWGGVQANLVNWRLDQAVLPALSHATQLGYYAVAVSLAEIPSMMIGATKNVVFSEASHRSDPRIAARATRLVILISLVIDLAAAALATPIVDVLFGHSFAPAVGMSRILLVANVPWIAEVVLAAGLLSSGRPGLRSSGQVVAAVATIGGLIALVPVMGASGAAVVSLVAYSINFSITLYLFHRVTGISYGETVVPRRADVAWVAAFSVDILRRLARGRKGFGPSAGGPFPALPPLPTDDDRPERRRKALLATGTLLLAVGVAGAIIESTGGVHALQPISSGGPQTSVGPGATYGQAVLAADNALTELSADAARWDSVLATDQGNLKTIGSDIHVAETALRAERAAHKAVPQSCAAVDGFAGQVAAEVATMRTLAAPVVSDTTGVLQEITQTQTLVSDLNNDLAQAAAVGTPAQVAGLQSEQVATGAIGSRRQSIMTLATTYQQKGTKVPGGTATFASQGATYPVLCARETTHVPVTVVHRPRVTTPTTAKPPPTSPTTKPLPKIPGTRVPKAPPAT